MANLVKVGQRKKLKAPGGIRFKVLYTKNQLPRLKTVSRKMGESEKILRQKKPRKNCIRMQKIKISKKNSKTSL